MEKSPRCLYENDICSFTGEDNDAIFGMLCKSYHGDAPTTTRDAWEKEIEILKNVLRDYRNTAGRIIFEYDIPRLGK